MAKRYQQLIFVVILALSINTAACIRLGEQKKTGVDLSTSAYLTVFLNTPQPDRQITIHISALEVYAEPLWYPLTTVTPPQRDETFSAQATQQLVGCGSVTSDSISRIRFSLQISNASGTLLRKEQTELTLESAMECKTGSSNTMFITSHLTSNSIDKSLPRLLSARGQQRPLADELLYILCPQIQTLYIARVNPCQIIAAYGLAGEVVDMAIDNHSNTLYLLDSSNAQIQCFDTIAQTFTDRIPLPLADEPNHIAISHDGSSLYVSDGYNRQLLQISSQNGTVVQQQNIGYQLGAPYPFSHNDQDYVALLSYRERQLTVLQAQTLTPLYSVNVGLQPCDIAYADDHLYVSDTFSRQILTLDPERGDITARIATTRMPATLNVDDINNNLIIASSNDDTLAFLPFGQQLVARRSHIGSEAVDTVIANARRLLFAATQGSQQVSVIDLPSEKKIATIAVAAQATVLAFQEP